jgi:hypothetical protein
MLEEAKYRGCCVSWEGILLLIHLSKSKSSVLGQPQPYTAMRRALISPILVLLAAGERMQRVQGLLAFLSTCTCKRSNE